MVDARARPALSRIGFRRDVRVFLTVVVAFLAALILGLLLLLNLFSLRAESANERAWNAAADAAAQSLAAAHDPSTLESHAFQLMTRYGITGIALQTPAGDRQWGYLEGGKLIGRTLPSGTVQFSFDRSGLADLQRTLKLSGIISAAAAAAGIILVLLYIPRILAPIETMLGDAQQIGASDGRLDEHEYLIETFRRSIETMRIQEDELKKLHDEEKTRADELELVSATLTRSLTSGFLALDSAGRIRQMNDAARETLGIPWSASVAQRRLEDVIGRVPLTLILEQALDRFESVSRQEVTHETHGRLLTIGLTAAPLMAEEERRLGIIALFTDLTPMKSMEARLRATQTLADLGEIAAGIAHEFRNSLSTILGYLKLTRRSELTNEQDRRVRAAEEEANQLTSAVERLLLFARPAELQFEDVDLREIAQSVTGRLSEIAPDVRFEVSGPPLPIAADGALLTRAIENLLRNAVESIGERQQESAGGGLVQVTTSLSPPSLVIEDDGTGLDPADVPRLFLPFQSDKRNGFGLGLSLARKIIVVHGGEIILTGQPGGGARVTIRFPEDQRAAAAELVRRDGASDTFSNTSKP